MTLNRRNFLKMCGAAVLAGRSLALTGCGSESSAGNVGEFPVSAEGSAGPPPRPAEFLLRNDLGAAPSAEGPIGPATQLISFGQITDTHISQDDFSVTGNVFLEGLLDSFGNNIGFGGLDRPDPQERYDVDVLQAIVKTMAAVDPPLDLIVHNGDALDAGTFQELVSFLTEINQSPLPWVQAIGNHDVLALGNIPPDTAEKVSDLDFVDKGQFITEHFTRTHAPTLLAFGSAAMGFDFGPEYNGDPGSVRGFYAFSPLAPLRNASEELVQPGIRFYVLDSTHPDGSALGYLDEDQRSWLAADLGEHPDSLAIVVSHHRVNDIEHGRDDFVAILYDHPQVIAVVSGHDHFNRIRSFAVSGTPDKGFWNIQTASLIDFPQEARIFEIRNNGDGTGSIFTYVFNQQGTGQLGENASASYDSAADESMDGEGSPEDRNVELLFQFPAMT